MLSICFHVAKVTAIDDTTTICDSDPSGKRCAKHQHRHSFNTFSYTRELIYSFLYTHTSSIQRSASLAHGVAKYDSRCADCAELPTLNKKLLKRYYPPVTQKNLRKNCVCRRPFFKSNQPRSFFETGPTTSSSSWFCLQKSGSDSV